MTKGLWFQASRHRGQVRSCLGVARLAATGTMEIVLGLLSPSLNLGWILILQGDHRPGTIGLASVGAGLDPQRRCSRRSSSCSWLLHSRGVCWKDVRRGMAVGVPSRFPVEHVAGGEAEDHRGRPCLVGEDPGSPE